MSDRNGKRMLVFGMTGSGKSYYVERIIKSVPRLLIFDPKHEFSMTPGYKVISGPGALSAFLQVNHNKGFRIVYEPEPENEVQELSEISRLLERLQRPYKAKKTDLKIMLVVDEAHTAYKNPPDRKHNGYSRLILMGRASGIDLITITQRPQDIGMTARDNVNRVACFQVAGEDAVKAASKTMISRKEDAANAIIELPEFGYIYWENNQWESRPPV